MVATVNYNFALPEDQCDLHTGHGSDRELQFCIAGRHYARAPDFFSYVAGLLILAVPLHVAQSQAGGSRSISPIPSADGPGNYNQTRYLGMLVANVGKKPKFSR